MNSIENLLKEKGLVVVSCEDDGMEPIIKSGKSKLVVSALKNPVKNGDIVIYKKNEINEISRVIRVKRNSFYLCKDNLQNIEKNVKKNDIIGIVTSFITDGKAENIKNKEYEEYVDIKLKEKTKLPDYNIINKIFGRKRGL